MRNNTDDDSEEIYDACVPQYCPGLLTSKCRSDNEEDSDDDDGDLFQDYSQIEVDKIDSQRDETEVIGNNCSQATSTSSTLTGHSLNSLSQSTTSIEFYVEVVKMINN